MLKQSVKNSYRKGEEGKVIPRLGVTWKSRLAGSIQFTLTYPAILQAVTRVFPALGAIQDNDGSRQMTTGTGNAWRQHFGVMALRSGREREEKVL